jgi:cholesterol oxidase
MKKINRRKFVAMSSIIAAGSLTVGCKKDTLEEIQIRCNESPTIKKKAIIIGSGFSGSIAAHRLTEAGHETLLLERGKFWDTKDGTQNIFAPAGGFTMNQVMNMRADNRSTFLGKSCANPFAPPVLQTKRYLGVMEKFESPNMTVIAPACLGGGTVVYGGIFAPPNERLYNEIFPSEIPYGELQSKWFPLVKQNFGASKVPDDIAAHPNFLHNERFKIENENAGLKVEQVDITYDWDKLRDEISGTRVMSSMIGDSMFGCSSGVKNSAEFNYLGWAINSGYLEVKTESMVSDIHKNCDNHYIIDVKKIDDFGNTIEETKYECEYLFVCAGSINTSKLMTKAKAKGTIPNLNEHTGQGWGHNGSAFVLRQSLSKPVGEFQAFPPNYATPDFDNPIAPIFIEHLAFPIGFECDCLSYFAVGLVKNFGHFTYNKNKDDAQLSYPRASASYQREIEKAFLLRVNHLNKVNGGVNGTILGTVPKSDSSAHPCGGMVIGKATDMFGRVKNHEKLYVLDSSLLPGSCAGANPAMTVSALAERSMENILNHDF